MRTIRGVLDGGAVVAEAACGGGGDGGGGPNGGGAGMTAKINGALHSLGGATADLVVTNGSFDVRIDASP